MSTDDIRCRDYPIRVRKRTGKPINPAEAESVALVLGLAGFAGDSGYDLNGGLTTEMTLYPLENTEGNSIITSKLRELGFIYIR
jgi:hypothetical protein